MNSTHKPRPTLPRGAELAALPPDGGPNWNRLVFEKSPYLQQHAANPVDWYPWGPEAFAAAKQRDLPVFLSIGYSTCHWCHVMEHESFEDPDVAALMNENFVCVKVDREERPDIDQVYMAVTIGLTGSGGWPMTVLMTAEKKPFFAGTYFPKDGRGSRPGMRDLVRHIKGLWKDDRKKLLEQADYIVNELSNGARMKPGSTISTATLDQALAEMSERYDSVRGGFSLKPKFPVPHNYSFLLRAWLRTGDEEAAVMVTNSLLRMRLGGIFDHVGYGFHRYSTDEYWLLPHFEKMLYDQALLAIAYTEAWQSFNEPFFRQVAEEIHTYVLRDLRDPKGGFYSAEDADSEGEEGKFYVWSVDEVTAVLGEEEGLFFARAMGFEGDGNFREEATGVMTGANIPHLKRDPEGMAKLVGVSPADFDRRIAAARRKLFAEREKRIHPFKDDKVLTDWNGLMIAALAKSGRAFNEPRYADAARAAADFLLTDLRGPDGRLRKRWRHGEAGLTAQLEDYAFAAWGMIELYEATYDPRYLAAARDFAEVMLTRHADPQSGGFFQTPDDGEALFTRPKEAYDGAIPSGNSTAALVLLKLARMTGESRYEESAEGVFKSFGQVLERQPSGFSMMMMAGELARASSMEIVLAGEIGEPGFEALRRTVDSRFLPNAVVVHRPTGAGAAAALAVVPMLENYGLVNGKAAAYVCRNFACDAPVTSAEQLAAKLDAATKRP